jgi:hypothetical protein
VSVLLGLCNPPRRGRGELAKPRLLYPLVWISCYDTISEKLGSRSRVGSKASDLESWVMCYDRQDWNRSLGVHTLREHTCTSELIEHVIYPGQWILVFDSNLIQCSIIHTQPLGTILLRDKNHWGSPWG